MRREKACKRSVGGCGIRQEPVNNSCYLTTIKVTGGRPIAISRHRYTEIKRKIHVAD